MTSLKVRLVTLSVLVLAAGSIALSSGAAAPPPPPTDIAAGLTGVVYSTAVWGDDDSDGDLDILLSGHDTTNPVSKIYRNDAGTFTDIAAGLAGVFYSSAAWGDYDSDGDLDLLLAGSDSANIIARIYRNDAGTFTDIAAGLAGAALGSAAWGDYDSDGDLDILLTGFDGANVLARIYRNDAGTFTDIAAGLTGVYQGSAAWGDYDSDGDLDILLAGTDGVNRFTKIYHNNGGSFTDIGAPLTNVNAATVAWGDYNSDGRLDFVIAGDDGTNPIARIYRNDGDGAFTAIGAGLVGVAFSAAAWGDYDSDGDLDLLLTGNDGTGYVSTIYSNDGGGAFTDAGAGLTGVVAGSAAWGDYNSDGRLDILLTGASSAGVTAKIYRNQSTTANTRPDSPGTLLTARDSAGRVTFSWKTADDSATLAAALTYDFKLSKGSTKIFSPMAASNGYRRAVQMGKLVGRTSIELSGLTKGTYKWSAQAVDSSFAGSAFAGTKTFKLPGSFVSIKLSPSKIRSCRKPRSATYKGQIVPAPKPAVKVTLQKRVGKHWKKVKVVKTNSSGAFNFKKVGKKYKASVRLRVTSKLPGGAKITSGAKKLRVKRC